MAKMLMTVAFALSAMNFDLQMFAMGGENVVGTNAFINAYNGQTDAMPDTDGNDLTVTTGKTFYDTQLLENTREKLVYAQFGEAQALPAHHGRTIEWRKWNTLPNADALQEGVIPTGKRFGMTSTSASIAQYGMYLAITDLLDLHAIDDVLLGATQELSASASLTKDTLVRDALMQGTNVMFCDNVTAQGVATEPANHQAIVKANNRLTPDMINKAVTFLKACNVEPHTSGKYIAVIHPYVGYDLRRSQDWINAHQYANVTPIYNGEIGELHGVRFVETTRAPIYKCDKTGDTKFFATLIFGKGAFRTIDIAGGNLEMIVKDRKQAGGPLEQYSTAGYKFEDGTKILYQERMIRLIHCSAYSDKAETNHPVVEE